MHSLLNKLFYERHHAKLMSVLEDNQQIRNAMNDGGTDDWLDQRSITLEPSGWWHLNIHNEDSVISVPLGRDIKTAYEQLWHMHFAPFGSPIDPR